VGRMDECNATTVPEISPRSRRRWEIAGELRRANGGQHAAGLCWVRQGRPTMAVDLGGRLGLQSASAVGVEAGPKAHGQSAHGLGNEGSRKASEESSEDLGSEASIRTVGQPAGDLGSGSAGGHGTASRLG
jgi:hypothetical protein